MNIVANWRNCWKWVSQQCFSAIAAGHMALALLPADEQRAIYLQHAALISYTTVGVAFLGFFGRLVNQTPPADPGNGAKP
jgi:hypothetical protein